MFAPPIAKTAAKPAEPHNRLRLAEADGAHEREADRAAEHVTRPSAGPVSVARADPVAGDVAGPGFTAVHAGLRSTGKPLDAATRDYFSPRFGVDFSHVRLHDGGRAAAAAAAIGAQAYSVGGDIVFGAGRAAPESAAGRQLLAHELAHVAQAGTSAGQIVQRKPEPGRADATKAEIVNSPGPRDTGDRQATVELRWTEDQDVFYERLLAALRHSPGFRDVDREFFEAVTGKERGLRAYSDSLHQHYAMRHSDRKRGDRLTIAFSAYYSRPSRDADGGLINKAIGLVEPAAAKPAVREGETRPAVAAPAEDHSLQGQAASTLRLIGSIAASADRQGYGGMNWEVTNNGRALTGFSGEAVGAHMPGPPGRPPLTDAQAAAAARDWMDWIATHEGHFRGAFARGPDGVMRLQSFGTIAAAPAPAAAASGPANPRTASQQFEQETGVVDPRRISKELAKIGAEAIAAQDPTKLENLPFTLLSILPILATVRTISRAGQLGRMTEAEILALKLVPNEIAAIKELRDAGVEAKYAEQLIREQRLVPSEIAPAGGLPTKGFQGHKPGGGI